MNKQNENKPGYKKTKVGWIPEEWEYKKIVEIAETYSGTTPSRRNQKEYFENGSHNWVKTMDLNNSSIISTIEQITDKALSDTTCRLFPINTVFVAMYGGFKQIGRTGILRVPAACNQALTAILPSEQFLSVFLILWLNFRVRYWRAIAASSRKDPNITRADVDLFPIPIPPFPEQKKIAEILSAWDRTIEQMGKLINAKTKLKKALMQQLLTGKWRFKEFVKTSKKQTTRYGLIPADWDYPKVGKVAEEVSNRNTNNSKITVLSCTKYDGLVESLKYFSRQVFSKDTSTYKVVKRGQFAYATNHIEEGSIGMLDILDEGLVSPMYTVFQTGDRVYTPFLYKVFKTELYRHIFEVNTSASVNRRGSLRWHGFALIHVPLPSFDEQQKISDCINAIDREIKLLKKKVLTLKNQKKGMMQKLLTGEIRVRI